MHTTTVRFDPETWSRLKRRSSELGVGTAEFIRVASVQRVERLSVEARIASLEETVAEISRRVEILIRQTLRGRSRR